ncbi:MAG TPA: carboxypeptidase regulatory-like domain-containing protein [Abditibacteriaceae bacterium]|jgi:hypothetical protein
MTDSVSSDLRGKCSIVSRWLNLGVARAASLAVCGVSLLSAQPVQAASSLADLPQRISDYGRRREAASGSTTRRFALTERDLTPNTASDDREPVFSPNGDYIAFRSNRTDSAGAVGSFYHIWVMNRDGSGLQQITGLSGTASAGRSQSKPSWSPSGNDLVYIDSISATQDQVFVVRDAVDNPEFVQVTNFPGRKQSAIFNSSGLELVVSSQFDPQTQVKQNSFDLYALPTDGSGDENTIRRLTGGAGDAVGDKANDYNPVFSAVSRDVIFFSSNRAIQNGVSTLLTEGRRIWVMQANGLSKRQVSDPTQRPAGRPIDSDDYPTASVPIGDSANTNPSNREERIAFQSDSYVDASDGVRDLNIWSLKVDSRRFSATSTTLPSTTTITESNSNEVIVKATVETNRYSSPASYRASGLPGSTTDADAKTNSDQLSDREPSFARSAATGSIASQIAFASNRKRAFTPRALSSDASESNPFSTHDIWVTNAADFTPPALIPQTAGNQLFPVVSPGPQAPTIEGRRRTYETGLTPSGRVLFSVVLREQESGISEVAMSLYRADNYFDDPFNTAVNEGISVTVTHEHKAIVQPGYESVALTSYDDGPPTRISRKTGKAGHELQADAVEGDGIYYCEVVTTTPSTPGDYYIDVSVNDNAGNSFTYDNIWGFSTQQFDLRSNDSNLFVSDYTAGQLFQVALDPSGVGGGGNPRFSGLEPVESYYLDNPAGSGGSYFPAKTGAVGPTPSQVSFTNVDVWRVQCRGPIPQSVFSSYAPTITKQFEKTAFASGKPSPLPEKTRSVAVAQRAVLWASPYTQLVNAGPGTLDDSEMQRRLSVYMERGGRLFVTGRDVIYALTTGGTQENSFVKNELHAKWANEVDIDGQVLAAQDSGEFVGDTTKALNNLQFSPGPDPANSWADGSLVLDSEGADVIGSELGTDAVIVPAYKLGENVLGHRVTKTRLSKLKSRLVFFSFNFDRINRRYTNTVEPDHGPAVNIRRRIANGIRAYFKTGGISGTVTNVKTNSPVSNFVVQVTGEGETYFAVTDSNGTYELLGLDEGGYSVKPALTTGDKAVNEGFYPGPTQGGGVTGGQTTSGVDLKVNPTPPGSLSGRAVVSDSTAVTTDNPPFANAPVLVKSEKASSLFPNGGQYAQLTRTDATGRFSFSGVPTETSLIVIFNPDVLDIPESSGLRAGYSGANAAYGKRVIPDTKRTGTISVPIGNAYVVNDGSGDIAADSGTAIVVNDDPTVTGLVQKNINSVVTNVVGATVELKNSAGTTVTVKTDAEGRYRFDDVELGTATFAPFTITVTTTDTPPLTKTVNVTVTKQSTFTVPTIIFYQQSISGTVLVNNIPANAATVTLKDSAGVSVETKKTSEKGVYTFDSLQPGSYTITASVGGASATITVVLTDGVNKTGVNIKIQSQAITGNVFKNRTSDMAGSPVSGATVKVSQNGVLVTSTSTDASGNYRLNFAKTGSFVVRAEYKGAVSSDRTVTVTTGSTVTGVNLNVFVRGVKGSVTLNGAPASNASVLLYKEGVSGAISSTQTATNGEYLFPEAGAGTYYVRATDSGKKDTANSAKFSVSVTTTTLNTNVVAPTVALFTQTISGQVKRGTVAISGATVQLLQNQVVIRSVLSGTNGVYSFSNLGAGSYLLRAIKDSERSADRAVTLVRGTSQTGIVLLLQSQSVKGRVLVNNIAQAGVTVDLLSNGTKVQSATTDSGGYYTFGGIANGTYQVKASKTVNGLTDSATTTFTSSGSAVTPATLSLFFETITGSVTVNGNLTSGVSVTLFKRLSTGARGDTVTSTTTDANGVYRFGSLTAGSYTVVAQKDGSTKETNVDLVRDGSTITVATLALGTNTPTPQQFDFAAGRTYHFSIPFTESNLPYSKTTVTNALSSDPGSTTYTLSRFDATTQTYVAITTPNSVIQRGAGYKIETKQAVGIVRPTNDATRVPTDAREFLIQLALNPSLTSADNGDNFIGFPFNPAAYSSASWAKTRFVHPDGTAYANLEEAVGAGVVAREMYTLSGDGKTYVLTDSLEPYKAYYVRTYVNGLKAYLQAGTATN